ncbi:hypothetical protein PHSY_003004 [Pseudozyma hubeiensis SY62]|uniref:Uncharacterized protein n=1 Tax=Pseudozyma hubeiensis (strain SY62) TaxID=1305764 RepID=R9P247_PSEHS|nr:hypothetical protein PHSY_003004 [Pseudozyma hubeiensis SY62]GAC95428.1 hypothetical protein PHSY_003004 [Pseudozyma hubeiensis SY62]
MMEDGEDSANVGFRTCMKNSTPLTALQVLRTRKEKSKGNFSKRTAGNSCGKQQGPCAAESNQRDLNNSKI